VNVLPSGDQRTIRHGDHEAVVVEVGGGLRTYAVGGHDVVVGYPADSRSPAGRGQLLMPWPNRIRDGRYTFGGRRHQLALTEPDRGNAIHGLVRWASWSLLDEAEQTRDSVTLVCRLRPQQGWEWSLDLSVTYVLTDQGLTVTPRARNVGTDPAPFGFGAHPFLSVGEDRVDEVLLGIPADSVLDVDDRLLPLGVASVTDSERDFRQPRLVGATELDHAFTDLLAGADGRWRVTLAQAAPDSQGQSQDPRTVSSPEAAADRGGAVTMWADGAAYPWLQVFTGDSLPPGARRTSGIAVEPMTCPPDAFNSGADLIVLEPGQEFEASWGITPG